MSWTHTQVFALPAPPVQVFRALTDMSELTRWFAESVEVGRVAGEPYRFWGRHTLGVPTAREATQALTRFAPGTGLGFTWRVSGVETEVGMVLAPGKDGSGTALTLTHRVDGDLGMSRARELIDDHWKLAMGNLQAHLAGGEGLMLPDYRDPAPEVRLTITIAAPPAKVFRALVEPEAVNRWFGSTAAVVEPRVGGAYTLGWRYQVDGREVAGGPTRILEFVPDRKLTLDWPDWRGDATVTGQQITFLLEPAGGGTRLTFIHSGFGRAADVSDYPFGWQYFLGTLRTEAER
ncbi:MAG: SRPBCC domain-containing protein [Gemmatimonadetes bacterium]|nr:SRPBCC domain-containing protein [Gemmatimonadota bacterium]